MNSKDLGVIDDPKEFSLKVNKFRLENKNKWYVVYAIVRERRVAIKAYNTYLQIFTIDGMQVPSGMDMNVKQFKQKLIEGVS